MQDTIIVYSLVLRHAGYGPVYYLCSTAYDTVYIFPSSAACMLQYRVYYLVLQHSGYDTSMFSYSSTACSIGTCIFRIFKALRIRNLYVP